MQTVGNILSVTFLPIEGLVLHSRLSNSPALSNYSPFLQTYQGGKTPILGQKELTRMGYSLAAYPLSLLSASVRAMEECLEKIGRNEVLEEGVDLKPFKELKQIVGFDEVEEMEERYRM